MVGIGPGDPGLLSTAAGTMKSRAGDSFSVRITSPGSAPSFGNPTLKCGDAATRVGSCATYNERENLSPLVAAIAASRASIHRILIADDGNPDGTATVARQLPNVLVLERAPALGYGHSMPAGIQLTLGAGV